jgi:hypothetical protein
MATASKELCNTESNFMIEMWKAINTKEIPPLSSLACGVIYFSLEQQSDLVVSCFTGAPELSSCGSRCYGNISLWTLIQYGLSHPPRTSPGFELTFKQICKEDLTALGLPSTLIRRYFTFTEPPKYLERCRWRADCPPIFWVFPKTKQTEQNLDVFRTNRCRQIAHRLPSNPPSKCASRLDDLDCTCLDFCLSQQDVVYSILFEYHIPSTLLPEKVEWTDCMLTDGELEDYKTL